MIQTQKNTARPSTRRIAFITIGVTLMLFLGFILYICIGNMLSMLGTHEQENIKQQGNVAVSMIASSNTNIQAITRDWSSWDETYSYVLGDNEDYTDDTMTEYPFLLHNLNFAVIKDMGGNDLYAVFYDLADECYVDVPDGFTDALREAGAYALEAYETGLTYTLKEDLGRDGLLLYGDVCYAVCAMPILTSDETEGPVGTFFFGRIVDAESIRNAAFADASFDIIDAASAEITALNGLFDNQDAITLTSSSFTYYRPLTDFYGNETIVLKTEEPRSLYQEGIRIVVITCVAAAVLGLLLISAVLYLLNRFLLNPLARLSEDITSVTSTAPSIDADAYSATREFHALGEAINSMLSRLEQNRVNLEASSVSLAVLKNILNGMDAYVYVSDTETDEILFINNIMKEHFGLTDDPVGTTCWKVLQSGLDHRCDFCPNPKLDKDPKSPVIWEEHNTVTHRYYRNIDRIIEWSNGGIAHMQHSVDITDMKLAEASLQRRLEQQELMSAISQSFTQAGNTALLIDEALKMSGEFMHANHAFLSLYNEDADTLECLNEWCDAKAQPFMAGVRQWPITQDMQIWHELMEKGYAAVDDFSLQTHPNFKTVDEYNLSAFLNIAIEVSGKFWGILGFTLYENPYHWNKSDIHLAKMLAGVFSGVISREHAEEALIGAKDMAEQGSRSKSDFLSRMSHEMRTPLTAIIGMTGIAKGSNDPEKKDYCLDKIDNASKHLLSVINDILDMSKIEANKFELAPAEFDLEKVLINITNVVNFRVEEKKQNFIVNIDENVPTCLIGDEVRLSQVITNFLSNAVKFTPEGGTVVLNVHLEERAEEVATLFVEVVDTGIGISPEQQARLFTSFEQADGGIARKYGGTGLGLVISKRIIELMGGRVWIESELGQGSKFKFTVKMKVGRQQPKHRKATDVSDLHVLAVDDSPEIRDYFSNVLPALGIACDVADGAEAALQMIKENNGKRYNIFFVDWIMPGIDGVELTRQIKRVTDQNAVIIMISVADWSNIESEAVEAGVDRFVSKPLFPSTLLNVIQETTHFTPLEKPAQQESHAYDFSGHTVLLAEDVEINREIISSLLEDTGIALEFAKDGAEALMMFERDPQKYSLILMDIHMPEMDGYEATRRIRRLSCPEAKATPIVAMTANVFREDVERCLQAGMNGHIRKPIDPEELMKRISKYLARKAAATTAGSSKQQEAPGSSAQSPVLDAQSGLSRVLGNTALYSKLLKSFVANNSAENLAQSMRRGDVERTALEAHALKGVTANLGLEKLRAVAHAVEMRAKAGEGTENLLPALEEAMAAALEAIDGFLNG